MMLFFQVFFSLKFKILFLTPFLLEYFIKKSLHCMLIRCNWWLQLRSCWTPMGLWIHTKFFPTDVRHYWSRLLISKQLQYKGDMQSLETMYIYFKADFFLIMSDHQNESSLLKKCGADRAPSCSLAVRNVVVGVIFFQPWNKLQVWCRCHSGPELVFYLLVSVCVANNI